LYRASALDREITLTEFLQRVRGNGHGAVLLRGAGGSFAVMAISAGLAFAVNALLARLLGVSQYGIYVYVLTWVNILAMAAKLGMETSLVRFVAAYSAAGEWGSFHGLLRYSVRMITWASLAIGVVAGLVVLALQDQMGRDQAETFFMALLLLPLLALTGIRQGALRGLKRVVKASLPEGVMRPLFIGLLVAGLYGATNAGLGAAQIMVLNLLATIAAFGIGTYWLSMALPSEVLRSAPTNDGRTWLRVSLPNFMIAGMHLVLGQTDIIMVGLLMGTDKAGIYAVATRLADLSLMGHAAANSIVAPMISSLYSAGKLHELQRMVTWAARGIFLFTLAVCAVLVVTGPQILALFGEAFVAGYAPLLVLLIGMMIIATAGSSGLLLTMTGYQDDAAWIVSGAALLNVVLNILLIPGYGLIGAAVATALSKTLVRFFSYALVRRRLGIDSGVLSLRSRKLCETD